MITEQNLGKAEVAIENLASALGVTEQEAEQDNMEHGEAEPTWDSDSGL